MVELSPQKMYVDVLTPLNQNVTLFMEVIKLKWGD